MKFTRYISILIFFGSLFSYHLSVAQHSLNQLKQEFVTPPDSTRPWVYWHWINDNISKEGITKDLQAMKNQGIGTALIANIGLDKTPIGKIPILSKEWEDMVVFAVHEGNRIGVDIGLFNSPGWSQSGGPWVEEKNSMKYLVSREIKVAGSKKIQQKLDIDGSIADVAWLAYPVKAKSASGTIEIPVGAVSDKLAYPAFDGNEASELDLDQMLNKPTDSLEFTINFSKEQKLRSLEFIPSHQRFSVNCEVFIKNTKGKFVKLRSFLINRSDSKTSVGPFPFPPLAIAIPNYNATAVKLKFSGLTGKGGFKEIVFSSEPKVEYYIEKQLGKMYQSFLPLWKEYQWPVQAEPDDKSLVIDPEKVLNLTGNVKDGILTWNVPAGEWIIQRIVTKSTGQKNDPALPHGKGLEVDKLDKVAVQAHFSAHAGALFNKVPKAERSSFKYVVIDSYESGPLNWTEGMQNKFKTTYGYDPLPWLPVINGKIVGSADQSNRFLWDLRKFIADAIATEYVGGLQEMCEQNGLKLWMQNYGHWGFPAEFLSYGGQSDLVSGEFWAEGELGTEECKAASSAVHIYGKKQVFAEAFTALGKPFYRHPGSLKKRGDWAITEGINHFLLHVYIHQPDDVAPGVNAWYGTEFNRLNTWFGQSHAWIDYLRRCHVLLQEGKYAADVCYFIGEDTPKMTGIKSPELPKGYSYDYINAEVILNRMKVSNGKMVLPDGASYSVMVLPPLETMSYKLLEKIEELVKQGAVIIGKQPHRTPGLKDYPVVDQKLEDLSASLWTKGNALVTGKIVDVKDLNGIFKSLNLIPDVQVRDTSILWTHRTDGDKEIYFFSNQSDRKITTNVGFRVTGKSPELWNAVTGEVRPLPEFSTTGSKTEIPLAFGPGESYFIVFSKSQNIAQKGGVNFPERQTVLTLTQPWEVSFVNNQLKVNKTVRVDELFDWSTYTDTSIKNFSGTATYKTTFKLSGQIEGPLYLDLGKVEVIATVKVNGKTAGTLWTNPWQLDISNLVKPGNNELIIEVTNLWVNTLINENKLSKEQRLTKTFVNTIAPNAPLLSSGLLGPVAILKEVKK